VNGADLLINMAGKSVNCRYNAENRAEILRSRIETTRQLRDAVSTAARPPRLWLNSSTATIYRHAEDCPMTGATGEIGTGFSVSIATAWEKEFFDGDLPETRRVALRMAIVLGDGSALLPLIRLARFGLGGSQLDGRWPATATRRAAGTFRVREVQLDPHRRRSRDHPLPPRPFRHFGSHQRSPNPSDNRTLMKTLREVLHVPVGLPSQRWMLEVGSAAIRTETELVLKSRWVVPERLLGAGYEFSYPELKPALTEIVEQRKR
jgi:NAD dependent epimerase/dehydratase family enzyme